MKLGIDIAPEDMELLRIAADQTGASIEDVMGLALGWGCQRLRDACPFPLPPEAVSSLTGALRAN